MIVHLDDILVLNTRPNIQFSRKKLLLEVFRSSLCIDDLDEGSMATNKYDVAYFNRYFILMEHIEAFADG